MSTDSQVIGSEPDASDKAPDPAQDRGGSGRFGAASLGGPPPQLDPEPEPEASRRRRWPWVLGAVVLVAALVAGAFVLGSILASRGRVDVYQLRRDVPAGTTVTPADVQRVRVDKAAARTAVRAGTIPPGTLTRDTLRAGQLLPADLLAAGTPLPGPGQILVGIAANPGSAPDGLRAGDQVRVLRLPVTTSTGTTQPNLESPASVLLDRVEVYSVVPAGSGSVVTIVVPVDAANGLSALSAQNRVAVTTLG